MPAYYNEIDPAAAAWLRELIKQGHIAPGDVDERSIEDVYPDDLRGYTQCHFFAGIGVWSHALRQAGWPDDRSVWTGSCPCQPFSAAGKGVGFADERHLWPAFFHLIGQCRPAIVFGEQVASKDGLAWLDLVQTDLEGAGYAFGAIDTCAAGFGAPHIRQRLYWVGHANSGTGWRNPGAVSGKEKPNPQELVDYGLRAAGAACTDRAGNALGAGLEGYAGHDHAESGRAQQAGSIAPTSNLSRVDNTDGERCKGQHALQRPSEGGWLEAGVPEAARAGEVDRPGPANGFWRAADWLGCRDERWRPVEPGACPLVDGATARVGRLRGYGNAIVAPQARAFIEAVMGD